MVPRSLQIFRSLSVSLSFRAGSIPENGSSRSNISASATSALASDTRITIPRLNSAGSEFVKIHPRGHALMAYRSRRAHKSLQLTRRRPLSFPPGGSARKVIRQTRQGNLLSLDIKAVDAAEIVSAELGRLENDSIFSRLKVCRDFVSVFVNQFPLEFDSRLLLGIDTLD